jgi:hypothetical protein
VENAGVKISAQPVQQELSCYHRLRYSILSQRHHRILTPHLNLRFWGRAMVQAVSRRPLTAEAWVRSWVSPCRILVDKVALGQVFPPVTWVFPCVSFHRCSITRNNGKNYIIFITGLHNKPQGCGASVASAAGPFTKKNRRF